jgi:hypothetical protein
MVIELVQEGKTTREIAKQVHFSLQDISKIFRKVTGDDESPAEKAKEEEEKKQKRLKALSPYAQSFQKFKDKRLLADVTIEIVIKTNVVLDFYTYFLRLTRMDGLVSIYRPKECLASFLSSL